MTKYDVGDRPRLSYSFTSESVLTDPTKVTFTIRSYNQKLPVTYTWLLAGGGDSQIAHDSTGNWHVDWTIVNPGIHRYTWESFDNTGLSLEATEAMFNAA